MLKEIAGTRAANVLKKKKIYTVEDVCRLFPSKYYDFSYVSPLDKSYEDKNHAFLCRLQHYEISNCSGKSIVKCRLLDIKTNNKLYISWFGNYSMYKNLQEKFQLHDLCFIGGKIKVLSGYPGFYMNDPVIFKKHEGEQDLHIYTDYTRIKGISTEKMDKIRRECLRKCLLKDTIPAELKKRYHLMELRDALIEMHYPHNKDQLKRAKLRLIFDDLFYFSMRLEKKEIGIPSGSSYGVRALETTTRVIDSLPFKLTKDQNNAFLSMISLIEDRKRLNVLMQGDVGCGKTIVAFLLMIAMAENGWQSVLLAPTQVLAAQHYAELKEMVRPYGIHVAFLAHGITKIEKQRAIAAIRDGFALMIVGTHSVLSDDVHFKSLALAIIDEEHRFGVIQRESICEKAKNGIHTVTMSATPIPRSLSNVVFSDTMNVFNIHSMPNGRKKIRTAICADQKKIFSFIKNELDSGHQAYVVCPLIEDSENIENLQSVQQTYEEYKNVFGGEAVAVLNGKMKETDTKKTIQLFKQGKIQVLISTTVVEVGVNVPNATVIVINNAERFGLASLHQLRGRVGRGSNQGYCILSSKDSANPRLAALCRYTDGFQIAEEDLRLRGPGNVIGTEQSGENHYISLSLRYPKLFQEIRQAARKQRYTDLPDQF